MNKLSFISKVFLFINAVALLSGCDNKIDITFPDMGIVTASEIGGKTVILTTSINSDGNSGIEDCGFVLSTDPSPTIDNNIVKISDLTVTDFSVTVSDLMPLTKYYARAYAINTKGISYSEELEFETTHYTYEGSAHLRDQTMINYFGGQGYTRINGTLFIGQTRTTSNISSLESLSTIICIEGALYIEGFNQLSDLSGLENLTSLGAVFIQDSELTDIDELINIRSFNSSAISFISGNNNLVNLYGLSNIDSIASYLHLSGNSLLTDLDDLAKLKYVGNLIIDHHEKLENLDGLSNLKTIRMHLEIYSNPLITNLDGLINISSIGRSFNIYSNSALTDFCALTTILSKDPEITFSTSQNAYNPTKQDILDGYCSPGK